MSSVERHLPALRITLGASTVIFSILAAIYEIYLVANDPSVTAAAWVPLTSLVLGMGGVGASLLRFIPRIRGQGGGTPPAPLPRAEAHHDGIPEELKGIQLYRNSDELKAKLPLSKLFANANGRINILAIDAGISTKQGYDDIKAALKRGITVRLLLVDENATTLLNEVQKAWPVGGDAHKSLRDSLVNLCRLREEVPGGKLEIVFHNLIPTNSLIIIDPESDNSIMQVTVYLYNSHTWSSMVFAKKDQPEMFRRYLESYQFVDDNKKTRVYDCNEQTQGRALQFSLETNSDWAQITYGSMLRLEGVTISRILAGRARFEDSRSDSFHINKSDSKGETTTTEISGTFSVLGNKPIIKLSNGHDGSSTLRVYDLKSRRIVGDIATSNQRHEEELALQIVD